METSSKLPLNFYTLKSRSWLQPLAINILSTFSEHSLTILSTFSEHSLNILWTFSQHSLNILSPFSQHSLNILSAFSEPSLNILSTSFQHFLNIMSRFNQYTLSQSSILRKSCHNQQHVPSISPTFLQIQSMICFQNSLKLLSWQTYSIFLCFRYRFPSAQPF